MRSYILILLCVLTLPICVSAKVELRSYMTDSMVMQRNSDFLLAGKAAGKSVTITSSWNGKTMKARVAKDGSFSATVNVPDAGGPFNIDFTDADGTTSLRDVWSGEVWFCSGQSNMEMPVSGWGKVNDWENELLRADYPEVRLLQVARKKSFSPQEDVGVNMGGWRTANSSTVGEFSSMAYFYARQMARELGMHVGVVDCSWGGTPAEAWMSASAVASVAGFEKEIAVLEAGHGDYKETVKAHCRTVDEWLADIDRDTPDFSLSRIHADAKDVSVPGAIENSFGNLDGFFSLQREIEIAPEMAGKPLVLNLGKIDDRDVTYFNGVEIGYTDGHLVERHYTVPAELVKAGKAVISARVIDFGGKAGIMGAPGEINTVSGDTLTSLAGEWKCTYLASLDKFTRYPGQLDIDYPWFPTVLYNAMVYPLKDMPVKGVLWYQGCANVGRDHQYSQLLKKLIQEWRSLRKQPDMPFYFMQLAGFLAPQTIQPDSEWAALRQAQAEALTLPNTGMATAIDIGNPWDIHPKNKQEAARRFALLALRDAYGRKEIVATAPAVSDCDWNGNVTTITYDNEIWVDGSAPKGFIVLTDSGNWSIPQAVCSGKTITLTADGNIKEIKYNWADYPNGNLRGETGLPVLPISLKK